jgi:putative tricarboxylic transport membrane protein
LPAARQPQPAHADLRDQGIVTKVRTLKTGETVGGIPFTRAPLLLYLIGGIGYLMRRYDFPAAPVIIGMILGPLAEQNFRQAMTISAGDWTVFFTRPLSATILALAALALFGPKLYQLAMRPKPDHVPGDA